MGKRVKKEVKRIGILLLAVFFLAVGVVGLVMPFLNGIIFLAMSLVLFSLYSVNAKTLLRMFSRQHHKLEKFVDRVEKWVDEKIRDADDD